MYEPEVAADKMLNLMNQVIRYKAMYSKSKRSDKIIDDISERQIKILIILSISKNNTVSDMAKYMNISKSTLSIILSKMIKKSLVYKEIPKNIDDKRKAYFKITEDGIAILKKIADSTVEDFKYIFESFSPEKKLNASEGINKLNLSVKLSKTNFYHIVINSDYYKNVENSDYVSKLAFKFYIFIICFIEYCDSIIKEDTQYKLNFKDITKNKYNILKSIGYLNINTVSKLEEYLCSSSSSVSIAISKLVKEGYLYKEYPSINDDGRIVYIHLTEKGKDTIYKSEKNIFKVLTMYFNEFSKNEIKNVIEAFEQLIKAFNVSDYYTYTDTEK